jgi:hypothetical protein
MMFKGLLDFAATPEGQGLLGGVAATMAGARRGQPWNTTGRGLLGGLASYGNALDRQTQDEERGLLAGERQHAQALQKIQMDQAMAQLTRQKEQDQWRAGLPGAYEQMRTSYGAGEEGPTMTPGNPNALRDYAMLPSSPFADEILKQQLLPKPQEAFTLSPGQVRMGANGQVLAQLPQKADKTSVEQMLDAAGITDPHVRQAYVTQALQKSVTHAPAASAIVNMKQETEEAKKVGGFFGEEYGNVLKAGTTAQSKLNRYNRLGELLADVDTGKFTGAGLEVAKAARSIGFNVSDKVGNLEAAQALSGEIALELRNPSGGAGMPGAMSDADRQFLQNMVPGLQTTPQGRTLMLDTAKRLAQRDIDVARLAREYRRRNGQIDEGFYEELATFSEANPLFSQKNQAGGGNGMKIRRVR